MSRTILRIAAIVVAFFVLAALRWTTPNYALLAKPIPSDGAAGEVVKTRAFRVTGKPLMTAKVVTFRYAGRIHHPATGGLWLAVPVHIVADPQTVVIRSAVWEGPDGVRYRYSRRADDAEFSLPDRGLQPGMERDGYFFFEVPEEQVAGGTLVISEGLSPAFDGEARIRYAAAPAPVPVLDLDQLNDKR